jgi:ATP/maltotriose-dependent transcriptional regulator MalT
VSDDFVESWRSRLTESLVSVARLAPQAEEIDFASGLLATGVLWPVREAVQEFDGDAIDAIRAIAGAHSKHVLRAVQEWDGDQLAAARALATATSENPALAEALAAIVAHFDAANMLASRLGTLSPEVVNQIKAALVNIGGIINIQSLNLNVTQSLEIPPPPRPDRPPEIAEFVGRTHELAYYGEMLATRHLAVISGMAGVGKTALAATLAQQSRQADQIFWHTFHEREGIEVVIWKLAAFLAWHGQEELWRMLQSSRQSGGQPPPADTLFDYLLQMVEGRAYLLCFDDLHLVGDDPILLRLVERLRAALGAGRLSLVITARQLPAFVQSVEEDVLAGLSLEDARLLLNRWGLTLPGPLFDRLYAHTGGNVQFLTLAINVLQQETEPAGAIDRLVESDDIERYLLTEVYERLTDQEQAVMGAVAVLMGYPSSQDAIEAVLDGESVRRTLRQLADRHLLIVREGAEGREYQQHAMVQAFYYDLTGRSKRRSMHLHAAAHYEVDAPDLLRAAIHYEKAEAYSKSVQLATENVRLLISLYQARQLAELLAGFDAQRLSEVEWIQVNAALGQLYAFLGERAKAAACYETAIERLEWLDEGPEVWTLRAKVFHGIGQLQYNEAPAEALVWLQRAFEELARGGGQADKATEAALYIDMAWAHRRLHHVTEAMDALQNGLARLPRRPSQLRGEALARLAALYVAQFDLVNAQHYAQMAVENNRHLRDIWHEQTVLVMLGTIKHIGCDWKGAIEEYERALALAVEIGDRAVQAALEVNLGVAHTNLGNEEPAQAHLTGGLKLSQQSDLQNYELKAHFALARLHMRLHDWESVEKHLHGAEALVAQTGTAEAQFHLPLILSVQSELALATGNTEQAMIFAGQSVDLAIEQEKQVDRAICQRVKGQVLVACGEYEQAEALLEQSLPLLEGRHPYESAKIKALLAHCYLKNGEPARAAELMQEARSIFESCGARFDLAELEQHAGVGTEKR